MLTREQILATLRAYKARYGEKYGIERIGLFGSYATGRANETSDVDVFVTLRRTSLVTLSRIRLDLEERFGIATDIVQLRERMNPYLKSRIENEALSA